MTTEEIRAIAVQNGVTNAFQYTSTKQVVWAIQKARGEDCCFLSDQRMACRETECEWRDECMRLVAEWRR